MGFLQNGQFQKHPPPNAPRLPPQIPNIEQPNPLTNILPICFCCNNNSNNDNNAGCTSDWMYDSRWTALHNLVGPGNVPQPDEETRKHCESETAQRVRRV